jgi:hypothetical protein
MVRVHPGPQDLIKLETESERGCSSAGRAPPLHGGGQGFESPHLHRPRDRGQGTGNRVQVTSSQVEGRGRRDSMQATRT